MARDFNGSSDRIAIGDIAIDGISRLVISGWIWADTVSNYSTIFSKYSATSNRVEIALGGPGVGDSNEISFLIASGSNTYGYTSGANLVTTGAWHHVYMSYDGSGSGDSGRLKAWFNGSALTLTYASSIPATTPSNAASATLGSRTGTSPYWDGKIAEFAIWTGNPGDLSDTEAVALLADGIAPSFLRKNGLHYLPLMGRPSPENDIWSTTTGTLTGTAQSAHPPMRYPGRVQAWKYGAVATTHDATGALSGQGSVIAGTAAHIAVHATSGALAGQGAVVEGTATNFTVHATSGDLAGQGAVVDGAAERTGSATEHSTSGALVGQGAEVVGSAAHIVVHVTSGALAGQGAEIVGVAAHVAIHATSGDLVGAGAILTGSAALPQEESVGGSGPGWAIDFAGIETRIDEERADREERRKTIQQVYRRATGQPLPDDKPAEAVGAEMLSAVKPAARKRMQAEIRAIAEIDQSIARLEKQIEAADMAYIMAEERDIVWIVSEYI